MTAGRDLTPQEGARFLFTREAPVADPGAAAAYRVEIFTPDAAHAGRAVLREDGEVELDVPGAADALLATARTFARLTARGTARRREDGLPAWPARVLRWRGPGRGS